ncbi:Uncharacterised protein [Mycobacterium tuberculosis]|nr:Uncharacterised protein [Mycobacterium tuberculosis]CNL85957.1 Uncharacterised protein [Mycobacterium tuberculosis]CNM60729.1 Uncharacterised protein [Mycobacterium tuberculosis]CNM80369.1 Uncharacterised protein [Mycobacterium tuberculosis]CNV43090.1 Uncharacterised protein [Mycobacterium tuberculosis]
MSLMPRSRLTCDSTRSPSAVVSTKSTPSSAPIHGVLPTRKVAVMIVAVIPHTSEPAKPSHDFFGLIVGTIGCLPNNTPTA